MYICICTCIRELDHSKFAGSGRFTFFAYVFTVTAQTRLPTPAHTHHPTQHCGMWPSACNINIFHFAEQDWRTA